MGFLNNSKDPPVVDLRKPVQSVVVQQALIQNLREDGLHSMSENMRICVIEKLDRVVAETIIQLAREAGITNLLLLNKPAILQALREYEERHLTGLPGGDTEKQEEVI